LARIKQELRSHPIQVIPTRLTQHRRHIWTQQVATQGAFLPLIVMAAHRTVVVAIRQPTAAPQTLPYLDFVWFFQHILASLLGQQAALRDW
jgi:hypothetical protein